MINVVKFEQNENAEPPIDVTEFGIVIFVNEGQFPNVEPPISLTFSPMINVDKLKHDENDEL